MQAKGIFMNDKVKKLKDEKELKLYIIKLIMAVVIVFGVVYVVSKLTNLWSKKDEPDITNAFISEKLEAVSDLTSAELIYNGLIRYTDGNIPILTQKGFSMVYCAEIEAGIHLSEVDVNVTDSKVEIVLPEIEVLDINIDSDSIQFYDEKSALFNWTEREDVVEAMKAAEEDVMANAEIDKLKAKAKRQTTQLLQGVFEEIIGDRTLEIRYQ